MKTIWQYFYNIAVSFDLMLNCFLGGDPRETVSKRMSRAKVKRPNNIFINFLSMCIDVLFLFVGETNHVDKALRNKSKAKEIWDWNKK